MEKFDKYVYQITTELQGILTAKITVIKKISVIHSEELWIEIKYKNKTYALTPYFLHTQFYAGKTVDEAAINGFEELKKCVIKDFGIGQLAEFQKI